MLSDVGLAMQYAGVILLTRYLYRELKAWLLATCRVGAPCTMEDVAAYIRATKYQNKYASRKLRAHYYYMFPCCALLAIIVFTALGTLQHRQHPTILSCDVPRCNQSEAVVTGEPPREQQANQTLSSLLGFPIKPCLAAAAANSTNYCYTSRQWQRPVVGVTAIRYRLSTPTPRRHWVDHRREYYFATHATELRAVEPDYDGDERDLATGPAVVRTNQLLLQLAQRSDETSETCLCSWQMGLADDNVSFLYYAEKKRWIVLLDPDVLPTAPTISNRVRVTVSRPVAGPLTLEHEARFTVAFTSPQFRFGSDAEIAALIDYNDRVAASPVTVLRQLNEPQHLARINIELGGDDATCFIYCRHPSHHLLLEQH